MPPKKVTPPAAPSAAAPPGGARAPSAPVPAAQPGPCVHLIRTSPFFIENMVVPKIPGVEVKCAVCLAIGVRATLNATRIQPDSTVKEMKALTEIGPGAGIDPAAFKAGQELWHEEGSTKAAGIANKTPQFGVQPPAGLTPMIFPVEDGENGETYHALIAAAMTHVVKINVTNASDGQKMLLRNYLRPDVFVAGAVGKKADATKLIAQTWVQTRVQEQVQTEIEEEKTPELFASIRDFVNDKQLTALTTNPPLIQATPSYLTKLWIDAVFRASGQSPAGIPPLSSPDDRTAVIQVRKAADAKAADGRFMDDPVITLCFNAIAEANIKGLTERGTTNQRPQPFKIVILLGDVDSTPAVLAGYQRMADTCVEQTARALEITGVKPAAAATINFKVYMLSNAFTKLEKNPSVLPIWKQFRDISPYNDRCPKEVKALAFYLALRDVYQEHMICIGFRSGTLDGAGFLGIPICYFDDTSKTSDPNPPAPLKAGEKPPPSKNPTDDPRLQGPGALDYLWDLRAYPGKAASFAHPKDLEPTPKTIAFIPTAEILKQAERIEALTMTGDPFIRIQTKVVAPGPADQTALAEALLVYGCLTGSDGRPLWTKRIYLMSSHYDMLESLAANTFGKPGPNVEPGKDFSTTYAKEFLGSTGKQPKPVPASTGKATG